MFDMSQEHHDDATEYNEVYNVVAATVKCRRKTVAACNPSVKAYRLKHPGGSVRGPPYAVR